MKYEANYIILDGMNGVEDNVIISSCMQVNLHELYGITICQYTASQFPHSTRISKLYLFS